MPNTRSPHRFRPYGLALFFLLAAAPCRAAVVYVNKNAPGPTHDGTSWVTAFTTVQSGVDASVQGGEVWVAAGRYKENVWISSSIALYGGFCGIEQERNQRNWSRNIVIVDADGKGRGLTVIPGTSQSATVDGFTVQKGISSGGGGIYAYGNANLANNVIIGNAAVSNGNGWGGGIGLQGGSVLVTNCLIAGNVSDQGGGVFSSGNQATLVNTTIIENRASYGSAVFRRLTGTFTIINSLLANNASGVYLDSGTVTLRNSNVYGNTAYNFYGLTDPTGTNGNISQDPKLSAYSLGSHLQPGSPCIDAGDDSVVTPGETDLYGKPRIIGAHVDMGADESDGTSYPPPPARSWHVSSTGDDANDGSAWAKAKASVAMTLLLAQAGDEVWVAAGTYPCVGSLRSGVGLYGGFAGTETARSQRNPKANVTALDGTVYKTSTATHAWRVLSIAPDATSDTAVDGFTIQNGNGVNGSGIYISGGSPAISNNIFTNNGLSAIVYQTKTVIYGGGIYVAGGAPTITGNTFTLNGATRGAGIYVDNGTPSITNNTFTGNDSLDYGGGICVYAGTPLIAGNTVIGNRSTYGGGVYANSGLIRDNLITSNQAGSDTYAPGAGGGLYLEAGAVAMHNSLTGNTTKYSYPGGGGAISAGLLIDNVVQDNEGDYGAALISYNGGVISRNTVTQSISTYAACQLASYGGTFANNLLVSHVGNGIDVENSTFPTVVVNNTLINVGPAQVGSSPCIGVLSDYAIGAPVFSNNIVSGYGAAGRTYTSTGAQPVFTTDHNNLYGNTDHTLTLPGASQVGSDGNISQDPLFVNPSAMDYRLQAGSPCIDAGNDAYVASGDRDLAGAPRIYGAHVDIGAYEYGSPAYMLLDAAEVLRVAAGISIAAPADVARLDVVQDSPGTSRLTVLDATRIAEWLLN